MGGHLGQVHDQQPVGTWLVSVEPGLELVGGGDVVLTDQVQYSHAAAIGAHAELVTGSDVVPVAARRRGPD